MEYIKFGSYAGYRIKGSVPMGGLSDVDKDNHVKRACCITAQVESGGMYGSVMGYDGTGVTACLHQAVSIYPREVWEADGKAEDDQGPLWKIVKRINDAHPDVCDPIMKMIDLAGWVLAADGSVRKKTGGFPSGKEMRIQLCGDINGVVPATGSVSEHVKRWMEAFAKVFSDPTTFSIQGASGEEFILKRAQRVATCTGKTILDAIYDGKDLVTLKASEMTEELDLAMCMFWSHSVNAPGKALERLNSAITGYGKPTEPPPKHLTLPWLIIRRLGNCDYGRWEKGIKNGRYQRTRDEMMKSGLWSPELFQDGGYMPADLPG